MLSLFSKIYIFLDKKNKFFFSLIILLAVLTSFLEMVGIAAILPLVKIVLGNYDFSNVFLLKDLEKVIKYNFSQNQLITVIMVVILIFFIFKALVIFFSEAFKLSFLKKLHDNLSSKLYENYIYVDYQKLSDFKLSEKLRNVGQVAFIVSYLKSCYVIASDTILFFFIIFFLLNFNFKITIILVITLLLISLAIILLSKNKLIFYSKIRTKNISISLDNLINVLRSLKEVVILKRRSIFKEKFNNTIDTITKYDRKNNLLIFFPKIAYEVIAIILIFFVIIFFLNEGKNLIESIEVISIFFIALLKLIPSFNKLIINFQNLNVSYFPAKEVLNELYLINKDHVQIGHEGNINQNISFSDVIRVNNLSFNYLGRKDLILENVNFEIKKGQIIGLYGPSGGGKSTLVNLLLGFLKPTSGNILIDSFDIKHNLNAWHALVSYVPQDIFLFNDTIKKNILFGLDDKNLDPFLFEQALEISNLNEFLNKTPEGLNTMVGENAMKLSGGQGQRICIARSLIKNPDIVVLDEATSKLDEKNEYDILDKLTTKIKGKQTLIIISHRYNTLKKFSDKVYRVENKNIKLEYEK